MSLDMRKHIGYSLLSIFVAYSLFVIAFYHVDIINGRMYAHAHYQKFNSSSKDNPTPQHSAAQLLHLDQLSALNTFGTNVILEVSIHRFDSLIWIVECIGSRIPLLSFSSHLSSRAPPHILGLL